MDESPNLGLPYILAAQSQKHVTHNEAIRALDAIVQLGVLDRDLTAPPASPADGARYIVGASPTGAWSGHAGSIAAYQDGAWMFYAPGEGWIAWVADEDVAVVWDGSVWTALTTGSGGGGSGSFTTLGINATADATNRLAVASDATLLNHDGDGHQLKINKASASDTASLLYQDAFSGRAELGLSGDDDFHLKVSADGSTWKEAILINRSTGSVSFPFTPLGGGGGREVLTGNRTYYVRTDGNDANDGLSNSSGGAFATVQKAIDTVCSIDCSVYTPTIQIGAGTYSGANTLKSFLGTQCIIVGDETTPANIIVSVSGSPCFSAFNAWSGTWHLRGLKLTTTGGGASCIHIGAPGALKFQKLEFGASTSLHMNIGGGAQVTATGNYSISGSSSAAHMGAFVGAVIYVENITVTLTGTPNFGGAGFAWASRHATIYIAGNTFSGAATGVRYTAEYLSLIQTNGLGANGLPGSSAGSTASGGVYA
ncbi:MAG: DUF2793 domain-containing protein [Hyphomicrobium sp.]|nr:DUF2793 domain-containing protein [Hyphomicrobium sp.]